MPYENARTKAGLSKRDVRSLVGISEDRLTEIEAGGEIIPCADEVVSLSGIYKAPYLLIYHCNHECPVMKKSSAGSLDKNNSPEELNTANIMTRLLDLFQRRMEPLRSKIYDIFGDCRIDIAEIPGLEEILKELHDVPEQIAELHAWWQGNEILSRENISLKQRKWYSEPPKGDPYRSARKDQRLNQTQMGELLYDEDKRAPDTKRNIIGNIENGRIEPDRRIVDKMINTLKCPELRSYFCSQCPVGTVLCRPYCDLKSLDVTAFRFVSIFGQTDQMRDLVNRVFEKDLAIDNSDIDQMFEVVDYLDCLVYEINSMKLCLEKHSMQSSMPNYAVEL